MHKNAKYKIGSVSKILGIPVQTLHYYEKCGFISPEKAEGSGYRYYDAWDINFLLDSKYWQSFEYSNHEIEQMVRGDTVENIKERFCQQEQAIWEKLCHYQNLLEQIESERNRLDTISEHLGKYQMMRSPLLLFGVNRVRNTYRSLQDENALPKLREWIDLFPVAQATFTVNPDSVISDDPENLEYWWGYSISPEKAKEAGSSIQERARLIPSKNSIYTIFKAKDKNTFASSLLEQVLRPIQKKWGEITGMPVGRLIVRAHDGKNEYERYFEIWVPVPWQK